MTDDLAAGAVVRVAFDHVPTCTVVRLTSRMIVTSRHCVSLTSAQISCMEPAVLANYPPTAMTVATPNGDSTGATQVARVHFVDGAECERGSVQDACTLCGHDLALLELSTPLDGPVLTPTWSAPDPAGAFAVFGLACPSQPDAPMTRCDFHEVQTVDPVHVEAVLGRELVIGAGVCVGDSGGPLLMAGKLVGILSRGDEGCSRGAYTRLDGHRRWLEAVLRDVATRTGQPVPPWMEAVDVAADAASSSDGRGMDVAVDSSELGLGHDVVSDNRAPATTPRAEVGGAEFGAAEFAGVEFAGVEAAIVADHGVDGHQPPDVFDGALATGEVAVGERSSRDEPGAAGGGGCSVPGTPRQGDWATFAAVAMVGFAMTCRRRPQGLNLG